LAFVNSTGEHRMGVRELIAEVERRVPEGAPIGTRHRASSRITTSRGCHEVAVDVRIDRKGRRREQYFCDGARVPGHVLLRLTCAEAECAHARMVRSQWDAFQGRPAAAPGRPAGRQPAEPLMREVPLSVAGHDCVARPATFRCFTRCPNHAHPPMWVEKSGYDLFENGTCLGGGIVHSAGTDRPRISNIMEAEAYLLARHLEAWAAVDAAAAGRPTRR
jgi:hypothetical protein